MSVKINPRLKTTILGVAVIIAAAVGTGLLLFCYPGYDRYFPPCPFYKLTHLYCPGCGTTRALFRLLHGDIIGTFRNNVLLIPSLVFVCGLLTFRRRQAVLPPILWGYVVLLIAFWILRTIPYYPFDLLAPASI